MDSLGKRCGDLTMRGYKGEIISVGVNPINHHILVFIRTHPDAGYDNRTYAVVKTNEVLPEMDKTSEFAGCKWKHIGTVWTDGHLRHVFVLDYSPE